MEEKSVVIIGSSSPNTLGVIESLAQKDISASLILLGESDNMFVCKSRFLKEYWICNTSEDVRSCLINNFNHKNNHLQTTIIPTNDNAACIVEEIQDGLDCGFIVPGCSNYKISDIIDKIKMATLAKKVGLRCPKTWVYQDVIPQGISFPCITKPQGGGKDLEKVFEDYSSLEAFLNNNCKGRTVVIQEFIKKAFEFQFLGVSLDGGDQILIPGRTHIERPNGIQNGFFLEFIPIENSLSETLERTKQFIKQVGYTGLFSVEFLHTMSGENYFLEMNYRNDGNAICATKAGVNLPYVCYLYKRENNLKIESFNTPIKHVYLLPEHKYFGALLTREIGFKEWFRNVRKANCYYLYFKDDKRPCAYFGYKYFLSLLSIVLRKITLDRKKR